MRRLVCSSKKVAVTASVYTPESENEYLQLIAYEPCKGIKRVKLLIDRYRKIAEDEYQKLIAL